MNKREDEAIRKQERLIYKSQLEEKIMGFHYNDFRDVVKFDDAYEWYDFKQFLIKKLLGGEVKE